MTFFSTVDYDGRTLSRNLEPSKSGRPIDEQVQFWLICEEPMHVLGSAQAGVDL